MDNIIEYSKEVERLSRISMAKDIEISMLEWELKGYIIDKDIVLEILKGLTTEYATK